MVNFKATAKDRAIISRIADRAEADGLISGEVHRLLTEIDLVAVHQNGCSLRLADLLEADDEAFSADVMGILTNVDRRTGKLMTGFVPRFSVLAMADA
ncbi:hypothetical protein FF100_05075 [Methylobacterium terricola]|uniref:DUF6874 domain-containing protein n=1 Tax=Methylobacterium terricola TaxID=2583531 RepID=A0A5C4LNC5_9HYPH|nr:hypothetical protein [Methylobacterium terricola]TNC14949.1 hypothetical protein FF100_05075 [Methylobacterium terricola]